QLLQKREGLVEVLSSLDDNRERVGGAIIRQQNSVTVVDQTARRGNGLNVDPIALGLRGVIEMIDDLEVVVAKYQHPEQGQDDHRRQQQARLKDFRFAQVIFKLMRL